MPVNSQSWAVHGLLIATPTVAAARELVSECSWPLLFPCFALKETMFRQCKCYTKQKPESTKWERAHKKRLDSNSGCYHHALNACWFNINIKCEKENEQMPPYRSQMYIDNLDAVLTSLRTRFPCERASGSLQCLLMHHVFAICANLMSDLLRQQLL